MAIRVPEMAIGVANSIGRAVLGALSEDLGGLKPTPVSILSETSRYQRDWSDQLVVEERLWKCVERQRVYAEWQQADGRRQQIVVHRQQVVVG